MSEGGRGRSRDGPILYIRHSGSCALTLHSRSWTVAGVNPTQEVESFGCAADSRCSGTGFCPLYLTHPIDTCRSQETRNGSYHW